MKEGVQVQIRWQLRSSRWNSDLKGSLQSQRLCSLWQLFSFISTSAIKISWQKASTEERACVAHPSNALVRYYREVGAGTSGTAPTGKSSERVIHGSLQAVVRNKESKCVSPCLLAHAQFFSSLTVLRPLYLGNGAAPMAQKCPQVVWSRSFLLKTLLPGWLQTVTLRAEVSQNGGTVLER